MRAKVRRSKINNAIVGTLATAGVLTVAVLAPNALKVLGQAFTPQRRQAVERSFSRLIRHGYIAIEKDSTGKRVRLTGKGEKYAALLGEGKLKPKIPKRWDGKWRLLIFDIPERRRKERDQIRATLVSLGFHRLQDSVWVYPYDCEDLVILLKADFRIGKNLLYVVADAVEYDLPLRAHFGLSKNT